MEKYIGLAIVCIIAFFVSFFTIQKVKKEKQKCKQLQNEYYELSHKLGKAEEQYKEYEKACQNELERKIVAQAEADSIEEYNRKMRDQADESAQAYYKQTMAKTAQELESALEKEAEKYQQAQSEFEQNYLQAMQDMATESAKYAATARQLVDSIDDLERKQRAAIEANKRAAEEENKKDFYRIQIPSSDLLEIAKLREIMPYLRDQDTLNKVIYKIYYENPVNDLIGRVVGQKQGGIYKITNIHNGKCYVGQAVNFANRWKQHIKRGVGAEPMTHNKLYPAMYGDGVENFTFEVVEECPSSKLNEREDYWQKYFGAKEYGYSIK